MSEFDLQGEKKERYEGLAEEPRYDLLLTCKEVRGSLLPPQPRVFMYSLDVFSAGSRATDGYCCPFQPHAH